MCGANSIVVVVVVIRLNPVTDTGHYLMPCVVSLLLQLHLLLRLPLPTASASAAALPAFCWCSSKGRGLWGAQFFVNLSAARAAFCAS